LNLTATPTAGLFHILQSLSRAQRVRGGNATQSKNGE
jgi:hypothetical protein